MTWTRMLGLGLVLLGGCWRPDGDEGPPITYTTEDASPIPAIRLQATPHRFRRPVFVGHAGDGSNRLFVIEQAGRVLVLEDPSSSKPARTFLDIRARVHERHNEEGLLAMAFHPAYASTRRFFVYYSADDPRRGVLAEFRGGENGAARTDSQRIVLEIPQPYGNHNGCSLAFGPDGYLYMSIGDGGWAGDPLEAGQDLSSLLATIIRIDVDDHGPEQAYAIPPDNPFVDQPDARGEIWASGLRNVWRMSFDRATGDLWAGDVGQNRWEEIDLIVRGGNYGWNLYEGREPFRGDPPDDVTCIEPVVVYGRDQGLSVTGGFVYRGRAFPRLQGIYFYADYASGRVWGMRYDDGRVVANRQVIGPERRAYITSFGEDEAGELYVCTFDVMDGRGSSGRVMRVMPQ